MSSLNPNIIIDGSGNVFADLGLPDADALLARADIVLRITKIIEARGLSIEEAAAMLNETSVTVSALLRGRLLDLPSAKLESYLATLEAGD